jgi:hypothetical protein
VGIHCTILLFGSSLGGVELVGTGCEISRVADALENTDDEGQGHVPGVDGRVAIVTGAGRGLGRSHALRLAAGGALVVVNDLGVRKEGGGADATAAHGVVEEIRAAGSVAVPDDHDIASETGARAVVSSALEAFGRLDIVVNNAGMADSTGRRNVGLIILTSGRQKLRQAYSTRGFCAVGY